VYICQEVYPDNYILLTSTKLPYNKSEHYKNYNVEILFYNAAESQSE